MQLLLRAALIQWRLLLILWRGVTNTCTSWCHLHNRLIFQEYHIYSNRSRILISSRKHHLIGRGHDRKSWRIVSLRQKHGRKRPWLDSAAYLLIIILYVEYLKSYPEKLVYRFSVPKRCCSKLLKPPSISSCTPARLKLIVAAASIRINTVDSASSSTCT